MAISFCSNCGNKLQENQRFCPNCGAKVENQTMPEGPKTHVINPDIIVEPVAVTPEQPAQPRPTPKPKPQPRPAEQKGSGMFYYIKLFFVNYAKFSGRAGRQEFWWPFLLYGIVATLMIIPIVGFLLIPVELAMILPMLAVMVRRLHDLDKHWAYIFISFIPLVGSIILLIWFAQKSSPNVNEHGYPADC